MNFYWPKKHKEDLRKTLKKIKNESWSWQLPVFLLNRCWLRLEKIKINELALYLPLDNSAEAPELKKYNQRIISGQDSLLALQECWNEFGMEDFYRALRISWKWECIGNKGWTYQKYISFINQYKKKIIHKELEVPIIVLGRESSKDNHKVRWIKDELITNNKV